LVSVEEGLEIVISEASDTNELVLAVSKINPDVVLLNDSHPMAAKEALTKLMTTQSKIRIVIVNDDNNWLHIFNKEDLLLTKLEDLLTAIKAD